MSDWIVPRAWYFQLNIERYVHEQDYQSYEYHQDSKFQWSTKTRQKRKQILLWVYHKDVSISVGIFDVLKRTNECVYFECKSVEFTMFGLTFIRWQMLGQFLVEILKRFVRRKKNFTKIIMKLIGTIE